jgi:hypothetical protein
MVKFFSYCLKGRLVKEEEEEEEEISMFCQTSYVYHGSLSLCTWIYVETQKASHLAK